jgi:GNAT superfamily N-acetyltransferase
VIERATPDDAAEAAAMAAAKRAEYERYSPVFWRVAADAEAIHAPFLARCIAGEEFFTGLAARSGGELVGIALTAHELLPPPLSADPVPSWLTDDFFVRDASLWATVGEALLEATERAARAAGAERLGYERAASWWVRPLAPKRGDVPLPVSFRGVVGQAPPVYDPGGATSLALELSDAAAVGAFGEWAAASGAVLAIAPVRSGCNALEAELAREGYEPASDWCAKSL